METLEVSMARGFALNSFFILLIDGYWDNMKNQKDLFDFIGRELGVKELSDWHKFSEQVKQCLDLSFSIIGCDKTRWNLRFTTFL